jgi:hypothetical protein
MKLIWGLQNKDKNKLQPPYLYDMTYLSIQMAKDLGYETVLYGTSDSINQLGSYVDEVYNTDELDYQLFDDLKIHIWKTRMDEYVTIDGDVFLHSPLVFNDKLPFVTFDSIIEEQTVGYPKDCLDMINGMSINELVPEWNTESKISFSTGLVRWKGNSGLLQYYIESYTKLRKWFLNNEKLLNELHSEFTSSKSLISHYICEHLLQRMVDYYELKSQPLNEIKGNSYYHWYGDDKFDNVNKVNCVKNVVETHKRVGGSIRSVYDLLVKNQIIKPILYP